MSEQKQKIVTHLWYDQQTEEAVKLYTSAFDNAEVTYINRFQEGPAKGNAIAGFRLNGLSFTAFDAGPMFKFSPANSIFVTIDSPDEVDTIWAKLSDGGTALMPLGAYPFSEKFGWIQDKFGLSWQLMLRHPALPIAPCLMFVGDQHGKAEQAMNQYIALFNNAKVEFIDRYGANDTGAEGTVKLARFNLEGHDFIVMDSGHPHQFTFTHAMSYLIHCENQEEVDHFWEKLSEGGEKEQCGWVRDRYGVSWQACPTVLLEMMQDKDPEKAKRVTDAMLTMKKLDIAELERAYAQK